MLIYGAIATFGFLFLLVMLFVGEFFGADHEVGAHDLAVEHGDADVGGGPSLFSARIMAAFLTAFGVGGIVGRYYGLSHPAASGVGVAAGVVMSGLVYEFARILYSQQASSEVHMTGLVGKAAEVTVPIPEEASGRSPSTSAGSTPSKSPARRTAGRCPGARKWSSQGWEPSRSSWRRPTRRRGEVRR